MTDILFSIEKYAWMTDFTALCIFVALAIKNKGIHSSLIAITVSVLFGGIMHQYAPMLLAITDPALQKLKLLAWYLGFACFYALGVYAIYKIHQVLRVNYQFIARMILLQFFVLGQLQLLRYAERLLWDTHYLKPLYQSGIVGVNVTTAIVTLGFALTVGYSQYQVNKGKKGVKWIL